MRSTFAGQAIVVGILRPGDDEAAVAATARAGSQQQRVERRLAVVAVGAEVAEVPARLARLRVVERRDRPSSTAARAARRAELALEPPQRRPAGERQVEVVARDQRRRRDTRTSPRASLRQRHRRVDVVERGDARAPSRAPTRRPRRPRARTSRRSRRRRRAPRRRSGRAARRGSRRARCGRTAGSAGRGCSAYHGTSRSRNSTSWPRARQLAHQRRGRSSRGRCPTTR